MLDLFVVLVAVSIVQPEGEAGPEAEAPTAQEEEDPRLALLESVEAEKVADGFRFTEGPVWHPDGFLVFSDIPGDTIYRWSPDGGTVALRHPAGHPNGNILDPDGDLITCEHDGRITRTDTEGETTTVVDTYEGKALNSPNDLVLSRGGALFFTDPTFGLGERKAELEHRGVYRLLPNGDLHLVHGGFPLPNGIALSPDEKTLYVSNSRPPALYAFDLSEEEPEARLLADMADPEARGLADGLKVDREGNIYATGPGGVWLFSADGGLIGRVELPGASNLCFGGAAGTEIYVTARDAIYRLQGRIPAAGR